MDHFCPCGTPVSFDLELCRDCQAAAVKERRAEIAGLAVGSAVRVRIARQKAAAVIVEKNNVGAYVEVNGERAWRSWPQVFTAIAPGLLDRWCDHFRGEE